jgi:hypothetical protein
MLTAFARQGRPPFNHSDLSFRGEKAMRKVYKVLGAGLLVAFTGIGAIAQGPRPTSTTGTPQPASTAGTVTPKPAPAPQTFKAKYEGGIFGFNKKQSGTLSFDDMNNRLVFRNKEQKEVLSIPYGAVTGAYGDVKPRQPTAAKVVGAIPLPYGANMLSWFAKKKYRYLTLQFEDADTHAAGLTSFNLDTKELLTSVLATLAEKAQLEARGEAYVRRREAKEPLP